MPKKRNRRQSDLNNSTFQASYHRSQAQARPTKSRLIRALSVTLLVLLTIFAGWLFRVDSVEVDGLEDDQLAKELSQQALDNFSFQWQVTEESIAGLQQDHSSSIRFLEAESDLLRGRLLLKATERQPAINWRSDENTYLIDKEGIVLEQSADGSLPLVVDNAGLPVELSQQAVPAQFVEFATIVAASDIDMRHMRIVETSSELYAELDSGYYVRFSTNEDANTQIDSLRRTQELARERGDSIDEYIDVRIPHKAYYR